MKLLKISVCCIFLLIMGLFIIKKNLRSPLTLFTAIDIPETQLIAQENCPLQHLACIMDGNRRWARERGLNAWEGHKEGIKAVQTIGEFCLEKNIKYLTLYILSPENFERRSAQEINYLFDLMVQEAQKGSQEFIKRGIRVRFLGDRTLFPAHLMPLLEQIESETAGMNRLNLTFLFCYGARQEIAATTKKIIQEIKEGHITESDITPDLFKNYLWTHELPDPDLVIRTGKVSRLSNFLLYQAAYSELHMLDCFWPEITKERLQHAYDAFLKSERRFGA